MENETAEIQFEQPLTDREIFTEIWGQPRKVFRYLVHSGYNKYQAPLFVLAGIARSLNRAANKNMGDQMELVTILGVAILIGGALGWLAYYIYAALLSWTGGWVKGQGSTSEIFRVSAYALIPLVVSLVFMVPQIAIYGKALFQAESEWGETGMLTMLVFYTSVVLEVVLGIWTIVLYTVGLSEIQNFSIGKSILNLLLPVLVFALPIGLIVFLMQL